MQVGTHEQMRSLEKVVRWLIGLNGADAVFTLWWVLSGRAREANPMMDTLLSWGPIPFVVGKLALVFLGTALLWRNRDRPLAVIGIFVLFLAYYALLLLHIRMMNIRLVDRVLDWVSSAS